MKDLFSVEANDTTMKEPIPIKVLPARSSLSLCSKALDSVDWFGFAFSEERGSRVGCVVD